MTDKDKLLKALEEEFLPKVYGFCRLKTTSTEEAEDLSQDIILEVLKAIHAGKDIACLNSFVWSISNHMFFNWLRKKKRSTTVYMADVFPSEENVEEAYILNEQKRLLHREIALLSGSYRKAVVMHYYDGFSCEEISRLLGKSAGTVKWWLHDARRTIKEGMNMVKEYGERSYRPGMLSMSCKGWPGLDEEPMSCVRRKSTQNILLAAYRRPVTLEDLCMELGIAAPYIEDEVQYLVGQQLMKQMGGGSYQTDFVILPGDNGRVADEIYEACFPEYYEKLMAFLTEHKEMLTRERFNTAGFSWERLLWVYIHMLTEAVVGKYKHVKHIHVQYQEIPVRPNGGRWIALGFEHSACPQKNTAGKEFCQYDGPVNKMDRTGVQGFFHWWSGSDSTVFFELSDAVFELCGEVIKGNIVPEQMDEEQKYLFSLALEKKLFLKGADGFQQNYYFVGQEECRQLEALAQEFYGTAEPYLKKAYDIVLKEYLAGVPKHLHWQMGDFLSNYLNLFVTCSLYLAVRHGAVSHPDENNKEWLSLFASE